MNKGAVSCIDWSEKQREDCIMYKNVQEKKCKFQTC